MAVRVWIDTVRGRGPSTTLDTHIQALPIFIPLETAKNTAALALRVLKIIVTSRAWVREMVVETSRGLRVAAVPLFCAIAIYMVTFGTVLAGALVYEIGAGDRIGPGLYLGLIRELSTWVTFMVVAAIMGSALAGDLGARRIREELDALDVLGVDKYETLVVPRVVAMTVVGLVLALLGVLVGCAAVVLAGPLAIDQHIRPQIEAIYLVMNPYDLLAAVIKNAILGFFIGIVACQKGLSTRGGAEGVGRAVNQTVVITFFGIWLINTLYNLGYLTVVPEALGLRG